MASYEQRGKMWSVRYRDTLGRNRREGGFRTKTDAEAWFVNRSAELNRGLSVDDTTTFTQLVDRYLSTSTASATRIERLGYSLAKATEVFGDVPVRSLTTQQIASWRAGLPTDNMRHMSTAAVKQVLEAAVDWSIIERNPASRVKNPAPSPEEFTPFADWAEVMELDSFMPERMRGWLVVMVGTGMRPQEWTKLKWSHVDLNARVILLPASVSKTGKPRSLTMRESVVRVLAQMRGGYASGFVFTDEAGGPIDIRNWRKRAWAVAIDRANAARRDAGLPEMPPRRPYDMRHTYATWSLRAGLNTFVVARRMGTSLKMIDLTYGHLAVDSEDHERALLDAFDQRVQVGYDAPNQQADATCSALHESTH